MAVWLQSAMNRSPFQIECGPIVSFDDKLPVCGHEFAREESLAESVGFYISVTNISTSRLRIENIFFKLRATDDDRGQLPLFADKRDAYPFKLPSSPHGGFSVEYVVPLTWIPDVVLKAAGLRIQFRSFLLPLPIYRYCDFQEEGFSQLIRALRLKRGE